MSFDEDLSTTPCPHCSSVTRIGEILCGAPECKEAEDIRRRQRAEDRAGAVTLSQLQARLAGRSLHLFCLGGIWRAVISGAELGNIGTGHGLSVEDAVFNALTDAARKAVA